MLEIESLINYKADSQLQILVFYSEPKDRRNAIAALKEALDENRVYSPIHFIKHAILKKWTPKSTNYLQKNVA